jgi:Mrp family chromosome partitioning ATPase/uncharacterized protein involved in exopolysaccharide biosynthesis
MSTSEPLPIPPDPLIPILRLARRTLRQRWVAAVIFVAVSVVGAGAIRFWPRQYRSETTLHYREGLQWMADESPGSRRVGQRLREVLLSRSKLAKVLEETNLFPRLAKAGRVPEAVEELRQRITFRYDQSDVFMIAYTGDSPEEAQHVTAKLAEMLIAENRRLRESQAEVTTEFLEAEKVRKREELAAKEAEQARFLAAHPEFALDQPSGMGVTLRARSRAPAVVAVVPGAPQAVRPQEEAAAPVEAPGLAVARAAEVRLANARRELTERKAKYTDQHPEVRAAAARVQEAEAAYRAAMDALPPAARAQAAPAPPRPRAPATPALPSAPVVRSQTGAAATRTVALETEWARLGRDVAAARERLTALEAQFFRSSMTETMLQSGQGPQIIVIDPAFLPPQPVGARTSKLALAVLALALALGVGVAAARAALDGTLYDALDVERLGTPVLSEVPARGLERTTGSPPQHEGSGEGPGAGSRVLRLAASAGWSTAQGGALPARAEGSVLVRVERVQPVGTVDERLLLVGAPDSPAAAAFRVLRHRVLQRGAAAKILVTSPSPGEGKTLVAVNLALALAEGNAGRVLLVEGNLRAPSLARVLGFDPPACLIDQLEHRDASTPWLVADVGLSGLHVAAVVPGRPAAAPPAIGALVAGLDQIRAAGYDHVVVDGPSVLDCADAHVLEEGVDGVLVALWAGRSRASAMREAGGQLASRKVMGAVLVGGSGESAGWPS